MTPADGSHVLLEILDTIASGITSVIAISAFIIGLVKPVRKKFGEWIARQANTKLLTERLDAIDSNIETIINDISEIRARLDEHIVQNAEDIQSSHVAQLISLRCQIREIYTRNYKTKTVDIQGTERHA